MLACLGVALLASSGAWVLPHRPLASRWQRSNCGLTNSSVPAGPLRQNVDYAWSKLEPGLPPCGRAGCSLPAATSTHLTCETMCNATVGCAMYVFEPATGAAPNSTCWLKQLVSGGTPAPGRHSRVMGRPAGQGTDLPTRWAANVTAGVQPLPLYPRPQMVRLGTHGGSGGSAAAALRDTGDPATWANLNGLWEWEPATAATPPSRPPFGRALRDAILVPFPVESCLSGVAPHSAAQSRTMQRMWYRLTFDRLTSDGAGAAAAAGGTTLLHFGAVDWQSSVFLNGRLLGNHTGGYDGFSFEVTLKPAGNELLVHVYDPSDGGAQPSGKQRVDAIDWPGGGTYTPSSGIWQTVWLEQVPAAHIASLTIDQSSTSAVTVTGTVAGAAAGAQLTIAVTDVDGRAVATATGAAGARVTIAIPSPRLWSPASPHLYDLTVSTLGMAGADRVLAYFGLRTFALGDGPKAGKRALLNGNFTFLAGFLDQSWWPDGQYTAPTDEALAHDLQIVPRFGLNLIRLHMKVNPERWYYHADTVGVAVFQDMPQKNPGDHGAPTTNATVPLFVDDLRAMVLGRGNHPAVLQWTAFNEGDCWDIFNASAPPNDLPGIAALVRRLDPRRLVDMDSGGGANGLGLGDVNDIHTYAPTLADVVPSATQYAMIGEFGGVGAFDPAKEWQARGCHNYNEQPTMHGAAATYIGMAAQLRAKVDHLSAAVFTQATDIELECDGFLNYDRSSKFSDADAAAIQAANRAIMRAAAAAVVVAGPAVPS